ncbi:hypothetical protein NE237_001027 [Protea cynaroides]|uniref:Uncharacterized protein n=1 Tax=Protea cynaroides TaxID=273540 RepID=A0A9Q0KTD4_9MAGN|nr:hypothetical protein NE237_001027 [Protea cynaroides]
MLGLQCRRLSHLRCAGHSSIRLYFLQIQCLKIVSSAGNEQSDTVDYFVNSCGLSPESALKASKYIALRNTAKADSVLTLFKNYGFTQKQISSIICQKPSILGYDPEKILKPKIELLCNMGISGPTLGKIISRYSSFLTENVERKLIPTLEFLKSFIDSDEKIAIALSRMIWSFRIPELMAPNIEILRNLGVPENHISNLLFLHPRLLTWKPERFKKIVINAKEMGLNPSTYIFIHGIRVLAASNKPVWEAKIAVFRSFGWLEDEISLLFRKQPTIFCLSEKTIRKKLDFFVNEFNWTVADFGKCPVVLWSSLEKRIVPRCSVLRGLLEKGLMKKEGMHTAFWLTDVKFYDKYVLKYLDEQPPRLEM